MSAGSTMENTSLQPGLAVGDGARVDDDRLLAGDDHRVDVDRDGALPSPNIERMR